MGSFTCCDHDNAILHQYIHITLQQITQITLTFLLHSLTYQISIIRYYCGRMFDYILLDEICYQWLYAIPGVSIQNMCIQSLGRKVVWLTLKKDYIRYITRNYISLNFFYKNATCRFLRIPYRIVALNSVRNVKLQTGLNLYLIESSLSCSRQTIFLLLETLVFLKHSLSIEIWPSSML